MLSQELDDVSPRSKIADGQGRERRPHGVSREVCQAVASVRCGRSVYRVVASDERTACPRDLDLVAIEPVRGPAQHVIDRKIGGDDNQPLVVEASQSCGAGAHQRCGVA
jgi:hypothetical protein